MDYDHGDTQQRNCGTDHYQTKQEQRTAIKPQDQGQRHNTTDLTIEQAIFDSTTFDILYQKLHQSFKRMLMVYYNIKRAINVPSFKAFLSHL